MMKSKYWIVKWVARSGEYGSMTDSQVVPDSEFQEFLSMLWTMNGLVRYQCESIYQ